MTDDGHHDSAGEQEGAIAPVYAIEAYEVDAGTVLYDTRNPLAWIESSKSISLSDAA